MKYLITSLFLSISVNIYSQMTIGYLTGLTNQGINKPAHYQPIYGITIQNQFKGKFGKRLAIESDFLYSQRMNRTKIQSDYFQYMLIGKIGKFNFFKDRLGIYVGIGGSYNASIDHSNPQNHTYLSVVPTVGGQIKISKVTYLELKAVYDYGVPMLGFHGGYYNNSSWTNYKGPLIMGTLKFKIR